MRFIEIYVDLEQGRGGALPNVNDITILHNHMKKNSK